MCLCVPRIDTNNHFGDRRVTAREHCWLRQKTNPLQLNAYAVDHVVNAHVLKAASDQNQYKILIRRHIDNAVGNMHHL